MQNPDLQRRLAAALERIGAVGRAHGARSAPVEGLSGLQGRVLERLLLDRAPRMGELAAELAVSPATLSEAVASLETKGHVLKVPDPEEHRAMRVEATRSGRALGRRIAAWPAQWLGPALEHLDVPRQGALLELLLEVIRALEAEGAVARARLCLTCRHFQPDVHRGEKPHHCRLLDQPLGPVDLRIDCAEHSAAGG